MKKQIFKKEFALNEKSVLIILRFLVILVSAFLVMYSFDSGAVSSVKWLVTVFALYLFSNIIFLFLDRGYFSVRRFRSAVFLLDIILISLLIYFSQGIDTDLYLVYFLIIFMAGGRNSIGHAFMMTVVVGAIYAALLSVRGGSFSFTNSVLLLRIPFFFILSFIFLYYADAERRAMEKQVAHMERLSSLGEMIAAVLHEIRNPLSVLLGYAAELRKENDPSTRQKIWDEIVSAAEKTSLIIKNIMAFVKHGEEAERKVLNINNVVETAVGLANEQLRFDKININVELGEDMPQVEGNAQSLEQVFLNLINNARNALSAQVENKEKQITVKTSSSKKTVVIEVSDNGPGMKKEVIDRLFEPFFTTRAEGTGLGLSLCYKIVRQHGGNINVQSTYGTGALFTVELPVTAM